MHSLHYERGTPAYRRAIAQDAQSYLMRMPIVRLESRLTNTRIHDLSYGSLPLSPLLPKLLAYGTKFCISPAPPTIDTYLSALSRFKRQGLWRRG